MAFTLSAAPTPGLRDTGILAEVRTTPTSTRAAQASRAGPAAHAGAAAGTPYRKATVVSVHIGSRRRERQRSQATVARTEPMPYYDQAYRSSTTRTASPASGAATRDRDRAAHVAASTPRRS